MNDYLNGKLAGCLMPLNYIEWAIIFWFSICVEVKHYLNVQVIFIFTAIL